MKKLIFTLSILLAVLMSKAQIYAEFFWGYPQCSEETITFTDWSTGDPADHWEWFVDNNPEGTNSPIFTKPITTNGRAHFLAPKKNIAKYSIDTFGFNLWIIWLMNLILYIALLQNIFLKIGNKLKFVILNKLKN